MDLKESENLELKKTTAELKEAIISIASILNKHKKGMLYFGVKNNGEVTGQEVSEATLRVISQTILNNVEPRIYPEIYLVKIDNKDCIRVSFEGHEQPYFAYGRAYIRVADEDRQLSAKELEKIIMRDNSKHWDSEPCKTTKVTDISINRLKIFLKTIGRKYDCAENTLEKLHLLHHETLTNAAVVLFGKKPDRFFMNVYLRCAAFATSDTSLMVDMQDFYGNIFGLIDKAEAYILRNIHIGMKLEGLRRVDVPEIHRDAIREAILNAFCHRDYKRMDTIDVAVFKDRVEIRSPGLLIDNLTINEIRSRQVSHRRNPLIAGVFKEGNLIESWGTGIKKMLALEPTMKMEEFGHFFIVSFLRKEMNPDPNRVGETMVEKEVEKVGVKVGENASFILGLILKNNKITYPEIAVRLKISRKTVYKNIERLKSIGRLKRIGPDKGGHWEVVK